MDPPPPVSSGARASYSDSNSTTDAAPDRPSFTFIDHDDDLTSKRIKDANARKAIRSHVMRDVRRRERLAGLKRTAKRDPRGPAPAESQSKPEVDREQKLVLRGSATPVVSSSGGDRKSGGASKGRRGRPAKPMPFHYNTSLQSLPTSWFFDPFCSMPGTTELPGVINHLLFYWKTVFVPTTFPSGLKDSAVPEVQLMIRSSFSDPGSFFGLMTMCAAHRASLSINRFDVIKSPDGTNHVVNDPEYCYMKAKSIREMNDKMQDPKRALSNEAFDTIINLLTGSLIAGQFDEARIHLTGLKRMVELRGGITGQSMSSASMLAAVLTTDVKAGSGLMAAPIFPLTWDAPPVPYATQQRIRPPESSPIHKLGSGYWANALLSAPLLRILDVLRDLIFCSVMVHTTPNNTHPGDHDLLRVLNWEVEHQLLSYVYTGNTGSHYSDNLIINIHPIEAVTRVAAICFLNHFLIVSPPSSGLGRALTKHLVQAVSSCEISFLLSLPKENLGLFAWALFLGAQGSEHQAERPWFVERLSHIAMIGEWQNWEQVSRILSDYFFIPGAQGAAWQSIWEEATAGFVISADE
ncbi:hypothetical protein N7492_003955 [Penicillium capsulatum]|uniref:Tachykinin family protein n=1 Tax=Penicillium capsulatum TaxID=69766 RepID=A0A9W9LX19_9EURO|nr:hypothetical protein N7492_003955 [Penicillium capsulatum]KAJ6121467.1 hypothetical protein N7512_003932 [Penicillium capsulatum]